MITFCVLDRFGPSLAHRSLKAYLGTCRLQRVAVNYPWALAYLKYSFTYQKAEEDARIRIYCTMGWRHKNNKTVILGALTVPINAQALLLGPSATEGAPSPDCTIKGNINRNGELIYHLQNQQFYARIKMGIGGGKRWFCTPEDAEAAGWRRELR